MTETPRTFAEPRPRESEEEFLERYRASVPPVVYLPLARPLAGEAEGQIEMRETTDGKVSLLAHSSAISGAWMSVFG